MAITDLLGLQLNSGSGMALVAQEEGGLCTCIKKMSGELKETIDLVLLPPLIIKNALPCHIEVVGEVQSGSVPLSYMNLLDDIEQGEKTQPKRLVGDRIDKSEEKQLYLFAPTQILSKETKSKKDVPPTLLMGYSLSFSIGGILFLPDNKKAVFE